MVLHYLAKWHFILTNKNCKIDKSGLKNFWTISQLYQTKNLFGHPVIMILHLKLKEKRFLDQCEMWLGEWWLGVDLSSTSLSLFIKSHFHFFQNFRSVANHEFDWTDGSLQQFNGLFVVFALDRNTIDR